jgi:hypothetical protein
MKSLLIMVLFFPISSLARAATPKTHLFAGSVDTKEIGVDVGVYRVEIRMQLADTSFSPAHKHVEFSDPAEGISRYLCLSNADLNSGKADVRWIDPKTNQIVFHQIVTITLPISKSYEVESQNSKCQFAWKKTIQDMVPMTFDFKSLVLEGHHFDILWLGAPMIEFSANRRGSTIEMKSSALNNETLNAQIYISSPDAGGSTFDLEQE